MEKIERNEEIEESITFDMVIDAKDGDEVAMGWYYYVGENVCYPFKAQCIEEKSGSPLKLNESVEVIEIASGEDCENEIRVLVELLDRTFSIPLAQ